MGCRCAGMWGIHSLRPLRPSLVNGSESSLEALWERPDREVLQLRCVQLGQGIASMGNAERFLRIHPVHELIPDVLRKPRSCAQVTELQKQQAGMAEHPDWQGDAARIRHICRTRWWHCCDRL